MRIKNESQEYISVGDLSVGFSENIMEPTERLIGETFTLFYKNGKETKLTFLDIETIKVLTIEGGQEEKHISSYHAINPRENIYFIDFIASYGDTQSISIILDVEKSIATVITGILPTKESVSIPILKRAEESMPLTPVNVYFEHAAVDTLYTESVAKHEQTTDLIGKRVQFEYSGKDVYEHIYINEDKYTWHCISGSEKGLSDTDTCFYYKIDDNFYLFVWIEKVIPTLGIVLEGLDTLRSYGKIYGYEDYEVGRVSNFPVGSYAKVVK
ncbi:molybdenum cofactor biosynthesis protein F [Oceanobacillus oncorhynchi subsp. incaldanensis]|uniref:MoaF C-terminal domain-containing protein n=1 Tax=Oceanobacillus aidingensis TaxID=645964 RepID=A0ABV9K347_9BACI|nr:MoaF C-terminal domain-containing protein [Oceanobacillus oncorhynchi]MDM8099801.1 MoaF C-terminal domain-containing protein [Oceanobacillus oncorhynchi]GIO20440.1 molybdenum cofactor biosynthesis protein F [Oceanobacillus oncorhynchi subsp. incaldanensis]